MIRRVVLIGYWMVDQLAALLGWTSLAVLVLSGLSLDRYGWIVSDFWRHWVDAEPATKTPFMIFAGIVLTAALILFAWVRKKTLKPILQEG